MKICLLKIAFIFLFLGLFFSLSVSSTPAQNSISGIVFDDQRQPVSDIYVELLDEVERLIGSRKTRGGFYTFQRLNRGIYYLKVRVSGTNFKDQKIRIDLGDLNSIGGVDVKQQDIYLEIDDRRSERNPSVTGVVFAQEIPEDAVNLYQQSLKNFKKNKDEEGIKNLLSALKIYPDYFLALERLGEIYLNQKKFAEAENALRRATEINKRSFNSFFNLAVALNKQLKRAEAAEALQKANEIDGKSINAHLLLGIIQRKLKQFAQAEQSLLKAKSLSQNKEADVNWQLAELFYFDLKKLNQAADELNFYIKNLSKAERENNAEKIAGVKKLIKKIRSEAKAMS